MSLSRQDLEHYQEHGFVVQRQLVDAERMRVLQREVDDLHERMAAEPPQGVAISWEDAAQPPRIKQLMNSEQVCPSIDAISRGDCLLGAMEQLIGPELVLYHSKLMMKSAQDGTSIPWHQDWGYWRYSEREPSQVNAMLAIDAATEANGALRFVPGSHKQGPLQHQRFETSSFAIGLSTDLAAYESVMVELEPGDVVFFGCLVIHGSAPNRSDSHRRANTFAFDQVGNRCQGAWPPERRRLRTQSV